MAWLLLSLFTAPAQACQRSIDEQAGAIKTGTKIEVALKSGEALKGSMGAASDAGFIGQPAETGKLSRFLPAGAAPL